MHGVQTFAEAFRGIVCHMSLVLLVILISAAMITWLAKTLTNPMRRLLGGGIVRIALAVAMVGTGIVESFSKHTNDPPRRAASPMLAVTPTDISNGWRVAATREGRAPSRPQDGTYTIHEPWLLRGGFEDFMRMSADGWSFPWRNGFTDGLTVFSDGEIRLALRTPYFPRPFDASLAVVPAFNWHLLPSGVSNVFWHAATPSNSLVVAWENAPVNYDVSCLTNFQAEFFVGGHFSYRYDDRVVDYAPVFPFDWDNDGLENSVDPDPLVAGPDAHGTNAEWYNMVCSNVLSAVDGGATGTTGILPVGDECVLSWRNGVNSNAYYFVDVVASNGPSPIYFAGDRESRLGNPVVVALAGITNHVPLLIGVSYDITSTVPFSVSLPDDGFATITTNCVSNYVVQWPLEFTVVPDGMGYSASAGPYDPGCVFQWELPTRSATCSYTTDGGWIGFNCHGAWGCECGGCSVSGVAMLEEASFDLPDVWCGCWRHGSGNSGNGQYATNGPSVFVSFDNPVVFYEDAYTNAPNDVVAKHSTNTTLTVFAYGGEAGGMLYVSEQKIGKLVRVGGKAISFPYTAFVPPHGGVSFSIEYEADTHSDSEGDIIVAASIMPGDGGGVISESNSTTAVKLELTPDYLIDRGVHRHRLGVRESVKCSWMPPDVTVICEVGTGGYIKMKDGKWDYTAPLTAGASPYLTAVCQGTGYKFALEVLEPQSVVAKSVDAFDYGVPPNVAGGAGMELELVVLPTNVSFMGIAVQEVPTDYNDPQGYFANSYFDVVWSHTTNRGAGAWHRIQAGNQFMYDNAEMGDSLPRMTPDGEITDSLSYGWIAGSMNWMIPVGWNETGSSEDDTPVKQFALYWQRFRMATDGTLEVEKLGNVVQRNTNSVVRLNGEVVPLRPR